MQDIENILKTRIEEDNAETFVVIVPTNAARLKRQRELLRYHDSGTVANLRVHTLAKICATPLRATQLEGKANENFYRTPGTLATGTR